MPNTLDVGAIVSDSADVFYFQHPNTRVSAAGTPAPNTPGTFTGKLTGVKSGNYGPANDPSVPAANVLVGTIGPPSATNTTTYTYVGPVRPVVDAPAQASSSSSNTVSPTVSPTV